MSAKGHTPIASLEDYLAGPLGAFLATGAVLDLSHAIDGASTKGAPVVLLAPYLLQDIRDYRGALQQWFDMLEAGGLLIVTVPHAFLYERQDAAPSRMRDGQCRLYTPRALIEEIEEALVPNSYRLRWLGDIDDGYDYEGPPAGRHEVAAVVERIALPPWGLVETPVSRPAPVDLFEPDHTRVGRVTLAPAQRILVLKPDHLGDFLIGIPALRRLRAAFPAAEITLVVGSWNEQLAQEVGVADQVITFDVFPRNSAEEPVDVPGKAALFDAKVAGSYDIAIDMRTDPDTRILLRNVKAPIKAGIGLRAQFPFLDIFLPIETHLGHFDNAWSEMLGPDRFSAQDYCTHLPFVIACRGERVHEGEAAITWGPYRTLAPGEYLFEPFLEIEPGRTGLIACDVALDTHRIAYAVHAEQGRFEIPFSNAVDNARFEFRLFSVAGEAAPDFRFYGGRLSKRGAANALHQSEYLVLLADLIALRLTQSGVFGEGDG
jgi:hypothetical protein